MTTRAQLRKAALGLPGVEEAGTRSEPTFLVQGRAFAELTGDGLVHLQLDVETLQRYLGGCQVAETFTDSGANKGAAIPLAEVNGMELNNVVYRSWLNVAPEQLAAAARAAGKGIPPGGPDALPTTIGKPATRALLMAGITNLSQVAVRTEAELLELHGVGPRAVRLLREALQASGRGFAG